jgi:hypothetical protein
MAHMNTQLRAGPARRRLLGFRRFLATQNWLWSRHLAALQPWDEVTELRWVRNPLTRRWELRGGVLPEA